MVQYHTDLKFVRNDASDLEPSLVYDSIYGENPVLPPLRSATHAMHAYMVSQHQQLWDRGSTLLSNRSL